MSIQVKFKFGKFKSGDLAKEINDSSTQSEVGKTVISMMKDLISKGLSPVRGFGRFIAYSAQRGNKNGYPKDSGTKKNYPDKGVRPVNLKLSGKMLESLEFRPYKFGVVIGIFGDNKTKNIAETHQVGNGNVPKRKFLPTDSGDDLNISIMREVKRIYLRKIKSIIKGL